MLALSPGLVFTLLRCFCPTVVLASREATTSNVFSPKTLSLIISPRLIMLFWISISAQGERERPVTKSGENITHLHIHSEFRRHCGALSFSLFLSWLSFPAWFTTQHFVPGWFREFGARVAKQICVSSSPKVYTTWFLSKGSNAKF